jgi:hypothetical protein
VERDDITRRSLLRSFGLAAMAPAAKAAAMLGTKNFEGYEVLDRIMAKADARRWKDLSIGGRVGAIAFELIGTPYVGHTLEIDDTREQCVVVLTGLDCVTLFESSLGMARMIAKSRRTAPDLMREVTFTRYRSGKIDGYPSRLHYTSDWFHDNQKKGVVRLITDGLPGARPFVKKIDFMSTHPESYRQLKANPRLVPVIAAQEAEITRRQPAYLPLERVADAEKLLQTGDIVGITTSTAGLDCSHTGLCYRDGRGALRFLHASSLQKKVLLDERLSDFLAKNSRNTGIMLARPTGP